MLNWLLFKDNKELSQNRKSLLEQGSAKDKAQISHWDCEANQKGFAA
jgi:hypothetical protein